MDPMDGRLASLASCNAGRTGYADRQPPTFGRQIKMFFSSLGWSVISCFGVESFGAWAWAWRPKLSLPKMALSAKFLGWPKNLFYIDPTQGWMVPTWPPWRCKNNIQHDSGHKITFWPSRNPFLKTFEKKLGLLKFGFGHNSAKFWKINFLQKRYPYSFVKTVFFCFLHLFPM